MHKIPSLLLLCSLFLAGCSTDFSPLYTEGWQKTDPASYGLDRGRLAAAVSAGGRLGYLHALLVWRDGQVIVEKYYNGFGPEDTHNIHSVSKSILSALVGIAREQNLLSLDQKAIEWFPEYASAITDPRVRQISLQQLLTMTGGFPNDEEIYSTLANSSNWVRETLATPLQYNPGERFSYLTFSSHLLSAVLTKSTEMTTLAFARTVLLNPLGMHCHRWTQDPQGIYFGGNDMFFTPREMLIFGEACLNKGVWREEVVIPAGWVDEMWRMRVGGSKDWGVLKKYGYGFFWWMGQLNGHDAKLAIGHGGQFIVILPELEMIIVTTSEPPYGDNLWERANAQEEAVLQVISDDVVGAVTP
ncbi:MAG TPA: serine hydrolase [bacterium]|nr:serine hydrolase [bacterium]